MDAFYASVEQLDFPELRGKAIAVGYSGDRGVITTASYEARKYGVKSAMSSAVAKEKCPHLIFVPPRFQRYKEISSQIRQIYQRYTDIIEPLSLDEAYLDVTYNKVNIPSASIIAQSIKNDIRNEINLIASAGISYNKFLAKMASDEDKPDGLFVIKPKEAEAYLNQLSIRRFYGVGKVTAEKFTQMGVQTGRDLKELSLDFLVQQFGKSGNYFYHVCRGIDERKVESSREQKSVASETTFHQDIFEYEEFILQMYEQIESLWSRYQRVERLAKTAQLKVKFNDFKSITRSNTIIEGFDSKEQLIETFTLLANAIFPLEKPVRLIGVQLSNFEKDDTVLLPIQLTLDF